MKGGIEALAFEPLIKREITGKWKPYLNCAPSGERWLGPKPRHWALKRVKYLASRIGSGKTPRGGSETYTNSGVIFLRSQNVHFNGLRLEDVVFIDDETDADMCATRVLPYDVLLNITGASLGRCSLVPRGMSPANVNQHVCIIRVHPATHAPFFQAAMCSSYVQTQIFSAENGISREGLNFRQVGDIQVPLPPLPEQRAIAAFLDRQTAKIDALVEKKRRLIGLLKEKRAALISHVVTKGLDPDVPMKDSGIEWLGKVPQHWRLVPLMFLTEPRHPIMYGIVLPGPHFEGGVPIVKGGDVTPDRLQLGLLQCTSPEIERGYERSRLRTGDIVYAIRGSIGASELVPADCQGANITQDAAKIAPARSIHRSWLLYAMKSTAVFCQLDQGALGATIRGINIRDLKRCILPFPPPDEQNAIATFLEHETKVLERLVARVQQGVDRLLEYRTALISAAVTGKIDVRNHCPDTAACPPDENEAGRDGHDRSRLPAAGRC